ncbi:MAG: hypothetical protein KY475_10155 [Planctomycetes bacterium]|nr:hypothetical protein [Planctomycetota bacterium]
MTATIMPAMDAQFSPAYLAEARTRVAAVALAAERFRLAYDRFPETLEELAPDFVEAVPLDPFDAEPLRYRTVGHFCVVYSVGEDCVDDGGREVNGQAHPDVALMVSRSAGG